jgi:hypothetical protein
MKEQSINKTLAKLLLVAILLVLLSPPIVHADEATDARIEKLEAALKNLQTELAELKAERAPPRHRPVVDQKRIDLMVRKAIEEKKGEMTTLPSWVSNITPFGDFRYRHEELQGDDDDSNLTNDRRRNRIRVRLGFKAKINDEVDTVFRIASGSSDGPTSTNQTVDGAFESKDLWLDLAYADWHPAGRPGFKLLGGKMKNPFYLVGKNQLIWDSDVNPEGGAASYKWDWNSSTVATVTGGAFWLNERESAADAGYFGIQGMLKHELDDSSHLVYGASFYDIGNIVNKSADSDDTGVTLQGNTDAGGTTYKYDYDVVEGFAEYGFKYAGMPVAVFGNYVENTAAPSGNNTAYSIGAQLNKVKKPGSWQFMASYREVESDAVFGGLSDSDFIDGGTGGKGWVLGYKYQLAKNVQAGLTYFMNDRDRRISDANGGSGSQYFNRLQADLIFKF